MQSGGSAVFPQPPEFTAPTPDVDSARDQAWHMLTAKYADAGQWAAWAVSLMQSRMYDLANLLGTDVIGEHLQEVLDSLKAIEEYTPHADFDYTAPATPVYTTVPGYATQTLGTIDAIPAVDAITVPDAPSTTVSFTNDSFSDTLLDTFKAKLASDLATGGTGLGNAEAALFARETARQSDARARAYTEITTQFSSRGFDLPPGALLAKQTEINNESGIRLADSSSQIMAESAKLAQAWNQTTVTASTGLMDMLGRLFDSKIMRDFEAAKTSVLMAIEGFKQVVSVALAKAELNKTEIMATVSKNDGEVKAFLGKIEGQVAPMKAIAETNQAQASAYNAAVQGATAALNAQVIPEELKIKGVQANAQIGQFKTEMVLKEAQVAIEAAQRQVELESKTLQSSALAAQQLVAAAMNGISASTSFGFSGSQAQALNEIV